MLQGLRQKNLDRWLGGYVEHLARKALRPRYEGPRHILFALCDHHEPLAGKVPDAQGEARVRMWTDGYPRLASSFRDADGRSPRHSFFFPGEEYRPQFLDGLTGLVRAGHGEVEVHLHHDGDTRATLEEKLEAAIDDFSRHGHISRDASGRPRWAFIHGNWALANGRADGRWCGVDDELPLLFRLGCYADFTFPSAPDDSQPNRINQIYWPTGDLTRKRCYEEGVPARVGELMYDRLLMIEGPLSLESRGASMPRIENSALYSHDPGTSARVRSWVAQDIHVAGRPDWVFVKVHTHGSPEKEGAALLGDGGESLHRALTSEYNDGERFILHYVTAREMYNIAVAAMEGHIGNPFAYRDHVIAPPAAAT